MSCQSLEFKIEVYNPTNYHNLTNASLKCEKILAADVKPVSRVFCPCMRSDESLILKHDNEPVYFPDFVPLSHVWDEL